MKKNQNFADLRRDARKADIMLWRIALRAGIGKATLLRWLREPERQERVQRLRAALDALIAEKREGAGHELLL